MTLDSLVYSNKATTVDLLVTNFFAKLFSLVHLIKFHNDPPSTNKVSIKRKKHQDAFHRQEINSDSMTRKQIHFPSLFSIYSPFLILFFTLFVRLVALFIVNVTKICTNKRGFLISFAFGLVLVYARLFCKVID